jgi:hypothetical protein
MMPPVGQRQTTPSPFWPRKAVASALARVGWNAVEAGKVGTGDAHDFLRRGDGLLVELLGAREPAAAE